ncbi:MAG: glycosyltransferase family 4 protein [Bacteroidetes bacterium]|nr:glycosyltransferase family 4 protein [Bacteroidota bacterium]
MKIALVADCWIPVPPTLYGGIERIIDMIATEFSSAGHDVVLVAHPDSVSSGRLIPYRGAKPDHLPDTLRNMLTVSGLRSWKPDIIHSFGRLAYLSLLYRSSIPKIMSYQREPTLKMIKMAMYLSKKDSLFFTGCSNYISGQIKPFGPAATVYNGIEVSKYTFVREVPDDAPVAFLGRIEPVKGPMNAIKAAKAAGRKLILAGNVPEEHSEYFETIIKPEIDGKEILYIGPVNDQQKNEFLGQCAAFLMPIDWNEPFGIVMAEAMACGTPVIGYPRGAVPEVVENGITGFTCQDTVSMATAINSVGQISRQKVRTAAETRFSSQVIAGQYLDLYGKIVARKKI